MCDILREIFKETNNCEFDYSKLEDRIALQKTVYILMNMGVNVGDYSFEWGKYGPYSMAIDVDAFKSGGKELKSNIKFSDIAVAKMRIIANYIKEGQEKYDGYTRTRWLECIASLHYLKYVLAINDSNKDILNDLCVRKGYLDNLEANCRAMQIADEIENM